jgi:hypothetical protein
MKSISPDTVIILAANVASGKKTQAVTLPNRIPKSITIQIRTGFVPADINF